MVRQLLDAGYRASAEARTVKPWEIIWTPPDAISTPRAGELWRQWTALARELSSPDVELTPEEFAMVSSTFTALQREGFHFDPLLVALLGCLSRQVVDDDTDTDQEDPHAYVGFGGGGALTDDDPDMDLSCEDIGALDTSGRAIAGPPLPTLQLADYGRPAPCAPAKI